MAPNADDALLGGLGSFQTVTTKWMGEFAGNESAQQDLFSLRAVLENLLRDEQTAAATDSILCAVLNRHFIESYYLLGRMPGDAFTLRAETDETMRQLIQNTLLNR